MSQLTVRPSHAASQLPSHPLHAAAELLTSIPATFEAPFRPASGGRSEEPSTDGGRRARRLNSVGASPIFQVRAEQVPLQQESQAGQASSLKLDQLMCREASALAQKEMLKQGPPSTTLIWCMSCTCHPPSLCVAVCAHPSLSPACPAGPETLHAQHTS